MTARVNADRLIDFASAGMPESDARLVADTLVQADLWRHGSHGVLRLGWYLDRIRNGVMKPVTTPECVVDAGAVAVIDGHDEVFYPGEMEATSDVRNRRDGLQLPDDTIADLQRIAKETGLEAELPLFKGPS